MPPEPQGSRRLVLASASAARARMLDAAGVVFEVAPAGIDEVAIRDAVRPADAPEDIAVEIAAEKALAVSRLRPGDLVIGADQVLVIDGEILSKPDDIAAARRQLERLRGRRHMLASGVACAIDGQVSWQTLTRAHLTMREFSTGYLDAYLAAMGARVTSTVGAYEIERLGLQLFDRVEGDLFTIQGMPLVELLDFLRRERVIAT